MTEVRDTWRYPKTFMREGRGYLEVSQNVHDRGEGYLEVSPAVHTRGRGEPSICSEPLRIGHT
jgi:hypothetical protein